MPRDQQPPIVLLVCTALLTVSAYLLARYVIAPAMVAGSIPVLSDIVSARGYGLPVLAELVERLMVPVAIALGALSAYIARSKGWVIRDAHAFWPAAIALVAVALASVFSLNAFHGPVTFRGDANDYLLMNVSLSRHLTPDLQPQDIREYAEMRVRADVVGQSPYDGYFRSPVNDRWYCWHFWLYPAVAVPAHWLLELVGASPLRAYELTNVLMFLVAMYAIARVARLEPHQRALFGGLLVMSPIAWYMSWPSAEVFTASLVVLAIALFTRERYVAAVLAGGLGATMNPSLLVLVAALAAFALLRSTPEKRMALAAKLAAAGALGLLAVAFNFAFFHAGNLIQWAGMASTRYITPHKVEAFFVSLDQGMLPYLPVVLVLGLAAVVRSVATRDWWVMARFAAVLMAVTLTATTIEWNSDTVGLRRHAMWIFPFVLWLGVEWLSVASRRTFRVVAVALAVQFAVFTMWVYPPGMSQMSPLTEFVLSHAPSLYSPVPTSFAARSEHITVPLDEALPAAFSTPRGVRKVLVDRRHLDSIRSYIQLTPEASARLNSPRRTDLGLYYLEFAPDTAVLRTQEKVVSQTDFPIATELGGPSQFGHEFDSFNRFGHSPDGVPEAAPLTSYALYVRITNDGEQPWYPAGSKPLGVIVTVTSEETGDVTEGAPLPLVRAVLPGEEVGFYAHFITPKEPGTIRVSAHLVQDDDSTTRRLSDDAGDYRISVVTSPAAP